MPAQFATIAAMPSPTTAAAMPAAEKRRRAPFGPGLLVTAAFVGPGTIATASRAGGGYGFALLWALAFSVVATMVLQEMAARQSLVMREGLAEGMRRAFAGKLTGKLAIALVVAAVGCGNAAYEAGNIAGAALALASVSSLATGSWALVLGAGAGALLMSGRYRLLERVLVTLVLLMSAVFLACAWFAAPPLGSVISGLLRPSLPAGSLLTVIALIGTTVVPYNLFLHANAAREHWGNGVPLDDALFASRLDTGLSIGLGGLITLAIMSTGAVAFFATGEPFDGLRMYEQLTPLLGAASRYVFAIGLFAAGLTSAITAPLAAGYAVCGAMGWSTAMGAAGFRTIAFVVLLTGTVFAALGTRPIAAIIFAQAANGLLLPFVAVALIVMMNRRDLLHGYTNGPLGNILGGGVVMVAFLLGAFKVLGSVGLL